MSAAFGVHFGSTSASIAVCKDGKSEVIANDDGDRTTPAIVSFTDHEQQVGLAAKQGKTRNGSNTICNVKTLLGLTFDDPKVQAALAGPVKINNSEGKPVYEVNYLEETKTFSPQQVATVIYKKMMDTAESHGGAAECHDAVISVPVTFSKEQRKEICMAATAAGFNVLRMIAEPSAAVLAYDLGQNDVNQTSKVLVFRVGGTSLTATVVSVNNGMYRILSTVTDTEIGGHMINDIIVKNFTEEFQRKWKLDCSENKRSVAKLRTGSEQCKHILSTMQDATISVDSLYEGVDFQGKISRIRFEALVGGFIQRCLQPLKGVLDEAGLTKDSVDKLIVCGGTGKIPLLQKQLAAYFPQAEILNRYNPDEVIALGCAVEASLLSACDAEPEDLLRNERETEVQCLANDLLIKLGGSADSFHTVLEAGTAIPVRRHSHFKLAESQTSFCLQLLEGAVAKSDSPKMLAKIVMRDLPAGCQVTGTFHVRSDGSLHVTCNEPTSDKSESVTVETS